MLSKAVVLAVHPLEQPRALKVTVDSFLAYGFKPIFVFDKLSPQLAQYINLLRRSGVEMSFVGGFSWVSTGAVGVGLARDAGIRHAYELGFDCIAVADTHVRVLADPTLLCRDGMWQGQRIDSPFELWPNIPPSQRPWFGRMYSITLAKYVEVYDCTYKPWSYEPLMALSRNVVKRLMDMQEGKVILSRGWGAELAELSMSVARLGYTVGCAKVPYVHRTSRGSEEFFAKRWDEVQTTLWKESFGIYLIKHVPKEKWGKSPYGHFVKFVHPALAKIAENFNTYAKYTTEEVYVRFISTSPTTSPQPETLLD